MLNTELTNLAEQSSIDLNLVERPVFLWCRRYGSAPLKPNLELALIQKYAHYLAYSILEIGMDCP